MLVSLKTRALDQRPCAAQRRFGGLLVACGYQFVREPHSASHTKSMTTTIQDISAQEILNSRGNPTLFLTVRLPPRAKRCSIYRGTRWMRSYAMKRDAVRRPLTNTEEQGAQVRVVQLVGSKENCSP